jgi:hypothetical protein
MDKRLDKWRRSEIRSGLKGKCGVDRRREIGIYSEKKYEVKNEASGQVAGGCFREPS